MKRWQDLGEVLDSDDEERSQSQERTPKRQRLAATTEHSYGLASEEAGSPKDASDPVYQRVVDIGGEIESLPPGSPQLEEKSEVWADEEAGSLKRQHNDSNGAGRESDVVSSQQSSRSAQSETLPDIREVLGGLDGQRRGPDVNGSTATSSPLSEREVSPPAASTAFRFPRLGVAPFVDAVSDEEDEDNAAETSLHGFVPDEVLPEVRGRRTFRARNEKQLHPYLFDKAQHQKQFKERGMRPIRYELWRREAETQEASLSGDESAQSFIDEHENRDEPSSELGMESFSLNNGPDLHAAVRYQDINSDEGELPEQPSFRRPPAGTATYSNKRRKLFHPSRFVQPAASHRLSQTNIETQSADSVHPSPPPTSSGSVAHAAPKSTVGKFRMPRGLTPDPLPTPQISSEPAGRLQNDGQSESDRESPGPRSRPSTISRQRVHEDAAPSSSESSEAEPEAVIVDRRLQRERKRIKGVLPASWLKIDFRAQQKQLSPSPYKARKESSPSPVRTVPQKGVAQRIMSKSIPSPSKRNPITISDDESDEPRSPDSPLLPTVTQSRLNFERARTIAATSEIFNDEDMEVDWVDPMLVGTARPRPKSDKSGRRQPRITESFANRRNKRLDLSEEIRSMRRATGTVSRSRKALTGSVRAKQRKKPPASRLSILDAPTLKDSVTPALPQFVRVAIRRARMQSDHARHTPTQKQIRLATREDTDDAQSVLRSWREGTILHRRGPSIQSDEDAVPLVADNAFVQDQQGYISASRHPLAEVSHNRRNQSPSHLRKKSTERQRPSGTSESLRDKKLRQTQLRPIVLTTEDEPERLDAAQSDRSTPVEPKPQQSRSRLRVYNQPVRYRTAQLETSEDSLAIEYRAASVQHRMRSLAKPAVRSAQLRRYLNEPNSPDVQDRHTNNDRGLNMPVAGTRVSLPRRPRKRQPCRVDAETREYRQPSEPLPPSIESEPVEEDVLSVAGPVLQGLGRFGIRYATDFDILPLALGTYFHQSSFIGSGDFAASLNFANRDLDVLSGQIRVHIQDEVLEWGAWTEDVAGGLSRIPPAVTEILRSLDTTDAIESEEERVPLVLANVDYLLRSTVRYFMWCVSFLDPIDRRQCISSLDNLIENLLEIVTEHQSERKDSDHVLSRCLQYAVVLCRQHLELCNHQLVALETGAHAQELLLRAAKRLASHIFPNAFHELRTFYEDNRRIAKRESGIRDTDTAVCSVVVLHHATRNLRTSPDQFWSVVRDGLAANHTGTTTVAALDKTWYDLFTILPALEIDSRGLLQVGSRFQSTCQDWTIPTSLIKRLFELYQATALQHGSTINEYVRATLTRCSYLTIRWGWRKCESVLGAVFDFFAQRGLKQLSNEELPGSPIFLDELQQRPYFEVHREDRAFHIFLKMLASALQGMRKYEVYADKKIGGIAWRFIPNHGRTYGKDTELLQEDLDALRNHHDLLCVLYYSVPPRQRIRVNVIQNLVDHSVSHREANRLSIRAWQRLASFQASTDEGEQRLEDLCVWFRDMMTITMNQYRLARSEVEQEVASARANETTEPSRTMIEDVVARNQRQIAATLVDLLAALKCALHACQSVASAKYLLNESAFWQVFDLFQSSERRLHGMLHEALSIVRVALGIQSTLGAHAESQQPSDESQDYGDSRALQQLVSERSADYGISDPLHGPFSLLISNIFGADTTTDDSLLMEVIDVWVLLAQMRVRNGNRTWSSYISGYSSDAWAQLRDTEQRRKYTPYFLSRILEMGDVELEESGILTSWVQSLVEREAKLKFQHALTSSLLARHPVESLIINLPFNRNAQSRYDISLHDFRQRRLALISSILSNMRKSWHEARSLGLSAANQLRQAYSSMLKQLMQSMKDNYQELQSSCRKEVADTQAEGAYVLFVQQVVFFLQEYTTDICPVDRFFTDSPAFPLPANDPTYVVGRLRSYVPKLNESGKRKELANFIQNVCERAIIDRKSAYLVNQLVSAMVGTAERGSTRASSLREVLCSSIFPAYVENALSTSCSWIMALPILETCERVAEQLLYQTRVDCESVKTIAETIGILVQSAAIPVQNALAEPHQMSLPHVQKTLRAIFGFAKSCLTCAQYFGKIQSSDKSLKTIAASFNRYAWSVEGRLHGTDEAKSELDLCLEPAVVSQWPDTLEAVRKQVKETLSKNWYIKDGQHYFKRYGNAVEVSVAFDNNEEKSQLLSAVVDFQRSYKAVFEGWRRSNHRVDDGCNIDAVIV